jgi:hypothetical protein
MYLLNLRDIDTGHSQRRERRVREAQQSAGRFAAILDELLTLNDTDSLRTFLTFCDIPIINSARPYAFRGPRPPWNGHDFLRSIGERNLRIYGSLHEAAMGFCDRHLRKLDRHCDHASLAGIPNFMHIALSIGNVLRAQVERIAIGLETTTSPLLPEDWGRYRRDLEEYLTRFRELMAIVFERYLPELRRRFKDAQIAEVLRSDLEALPQLCAIFLGVRDRIEACRKGSLRVRTTFGAVEPPLFDHDLLSVSRWTGWARDVGASLRSTNAWLERTHGPDSVVV